ncbi:anthranilate synthase component II [Effusibacillus lacus]|uniref:Anthranilate/aminodeoxychorismate synthase component II n=1 Tax=Effusibacillus lacus TaxID=1348429 RepID=A0A292YPW3_9BACL|nr:aminodeoxychorismate/anthranilate synthase component II [Effusibacillus lacus]TCS68055.1 anthranilate synthase component II [Effusibacillus lacus]GAX90949.1 anthranilate/aminodeoxychorismate synthase component II [Effusibacillus lacus]
MIGVIDNYDSFTYNLVQYLREFGCDVKIFRNDKVTVSELAGLPLTHLLVSPGPCTPDDAGISMEAIRFFAGKIPILGVCLGHQSIGQVFGGKIVKARKMMHGKTSLISHTGSGVFETLPNPFRATRYHSLVIEPESVPDCLEVLAQSEDGEVMAVRHKEFAITGVQFHPESILTEGGKTIIRNFLNQRERIFV